MKLEPRTVMVIEDDLECLEAMTDVLQYAGYQVATAANGLEALRYLEVNPPPALILLDLMLPVMDGWQFIKELRARPVAGHIRKPSDLGVLLATVQKLAGDP